MTPVATQTDMDALKTRLKATWMDGNYDRFSRVMETSAVEFLDRLGVKPGDAARRRVRFGSARLDRRAPRRQGHRRRHRRQLDRAARGRAAAEGLDARFDEGDAEALPYPTPASTWSRQSSARCSRRAPSESRPSCCGSAAPADDRDGQLDQGRLHRPDVQDHRALHLAAGHAVAGAVGRREHRARALRRRRLQPAPDARDLPLRLSVRAGGRGRVLPPNYGPTTRAFATLGEPERTALRDDLVTLWTTNNKAAGPPHQVEAEYLEVVGVRA